MDEDSTATATASTPRAPSSSGRPSALNASRGAGSVPPLDRRLNVDAPPSRRADALPELGRLGEVRVQVAVDSAPWDLPIDALVVSVGAGGLGQLGMAARQALPGLPWDVEVGWVVSPDEPRVMTVPPGKPWVDHRLLRLVILATAREANGPAWSVEPPATLEAVRRAAVAAIRLAITRGAAGLGLPLLGAGAIGFANSEAAFEVVTAVRAALREQPSVPGGRLSSLVLVCRDQAARRAIERVWGYGQLFADARSDALRDEALIAESAAAGMPAQVLDVPDEVLWQPCLPELTRLRHSDTELDDLRATLVGSLDRERSLLEQGTPTSKPRQPRTKGRWLPAPDQRHEMALADVEQDIDDLLQRDTRWRELLRARDDALTQLRAALLEESALPRLRQAINDRRDAHRPTTLTARRADFRLALTRPDTTGLRGDPRPGGLVHTTAHDELEDLLDPARSPRASVGLAGPHGCGKSTLLKEFTGSWSRGLSIFEPPPATYASREFLLHLYGRVCEGVLEKGLDPRVRIRDGRVPPARLRATNRVSLVVVPALVLVAGVAALTTSPAWTGASPAELRSAGSAVLVAALVPYLLLLLRSLPLTSLLLRRRGGASEAYESSGLLLRDRLGWRLPGPARVLLVAAAVGVAVIAASLGLLSVRSAVGVVLLLVAIGTGMFWVRRAPQLGPPPDDVPSAPAATASRQDPAVALTDRSGDALVATHVALSRRTVLLLGVAAAQLTVAVAGTALLVLDPPAAPLDSRLVTGAVLVAAGLAALLPGLRWHTALEREVTARLPKPDDPHSYRARKDLDRSAISAP